MKVLYVQHAQVMGGSVVSLKYMILEAQSRGVECVVLVPNSAIAQFYQDLNCAIEIQRVPNWCHYSAEVYGFFTPRKTLGNLFWSFLVFWRFKSVVRKHRPDLIHLNSLTLIFHAIYARILGVKLVWHIRENIAKGSFGIRRALYSRFIAVVADLVVFISPKEKSLMPVSFRCSLVAYNFAKFKNPIPIREPNDDFKLLVLGVYAPLKGSDVITAALDLLPSKFQLKWVGEKRSSISKIRFFEPTLNIESFLDEAHLLIFFSNQPHFPRPVFEAWLKGLPVLLSPVIADGNSFDSTVCEIAQDYSANALAKSIQSVSENYAEHLNRAQVGMQIAYKKFGPKNFDAIFDEYKRLMTPAK